MGVRECSIWLDLLTSNNSHLVKPWSICPQNLWMGEARANHRLYSMVLNDDRHHQVFVKIPVHKPHLHQTCIPQYLPLNQALVDYCLITA